MNIPPSLRRCCTECLDVCRSVDSTVQLMETVAANAPEYKEEADQLRDARDHLAALASAILAFQPTPPA